RGEIAELVFAELALCHDEGFDLLPENGIGYSDDGHLEDPGMLTQRLLDRHRRDVLAAATDDVLLAIDEVEPAALIEITEVTGQEPFATKRVLGLLGIAKVRRHAVGRAHGDLTRLSRRQLATLL